MSAETARYEPGPSFVDDLPLDIDPSDLPPWLRDMAQPIEPVAEGRPVAAMATAIDEGIPDWLRAARSEPAAPSMQTAPANPAPAPAPAAAAASVEPSFSFLSEEDLPEWLRALGDESPQPEPATAPPMTLQAAPVATPQEAAKPPSVSRAWLARPRSLESDSAAQAAEEFAPLVSLAQAHPAAPVATPPAAPISVSNKRSAAARLTDPENRRLLVMVAAAVVLVVLVLLLATIVL